MKRKKAKAKAVEKAKKAPAKPRNPHARALKESGLFKPKVVPAAKDGPYRRRSKHPEPLPRADEDAGDT
jgi:hypothetical protein